ncbi:MAG TPA: tyrosine-type recombinase/integrase [Gammaproteobacteria bacterium]|nr:tyrosine-type recombinase/integrase [Gammaproteobacteria bacterium]
MRRWDRLLDSYIEEYRARGVCTQSVAHTRARLDRWGRWLKQRRPRVGIEHIDADMITRYLASCSSFRAKATVYGTLSTLRGFGDYLVRQGLWTINPLRWMKGPKVTPYSRLPKRIDRAHMEAIWKEAARRGGDYSAHLWVTVLAMLYGTGLRRGELERLNMDAFDCAEGTLRIDGRKTGCERCVPLPEMVQRCLEAYLPRRHNQLEAAGLLGEPALLVTRHGARLSGNAISNGIHALARRVGVSIHSLHQFRHTCASDLLEAGVHLAQVQRILGHSGIATTVRYVHIADPQRRAAMAVHPLNDWLAPLRVAA